MFPRKTIMEKRFFDAVATLTGTTIGAGVLAIPYVVAQAGMLIGAANIIIIGAATLALYGIGKEEAGKEAD